MGPLTFLSASMLGLGCTAAPPPDRPQGGLDDSTASPIATELFASEPVLSASAALVGGARRLEVHALTDATLEVSCAGPSGLRTVTWPAGQDFDVPWVGLHPQEDHTLTLTLTADDGRTDRRTLSVRGDELPVNLPDLDVLTPPDGGTLNGHTLFATTSPGAPGAWMLLLDPQGTLVWWAYTAVRVGTLERTSTGTLLGLGEADIVEWDWLGTPLRHWTTRPDGEGTPIVGASYVHHELVATSSGLLLTLDHVAAEVDDVPISYTDLETLSPARIADDRILAIDPNGQLVQTVSLAERLPTSRISFDSLTPVGPLEGALDWAHANGLAVDDDDGWVVSLRHQDALVKLDANGELAWILGDPSGWPLPWRDQLLVADGALTWPYHQHAPELRREDDGLHLLLFDNVNRGHTPYTEAPAARPSRLVEYVVDEAQGTVREAWSFELTEDGPLAAPALGDADRLSNGHILGVWGMLAEEEGVPHAEQGRADRSARIAEVDPSRQAVVFDLRVSWPRSRGTEGWTVYRAQRIERLHPTALLETP